jgi:hypothetical protein
MHTLVAQGGSVEALKYLQQQGSVFTPLRLTHMLNVAGAHNQLAAAQRLRKQGAEWPDALCFFEGIIWHDGPLEWSGDTLAWARAEGCTSPTSLG